MNSVPIANREQQLAYLDFGLGISTFHACHALASRRGCQCVNHRSLKSERRPRLRHRRRLDAGQRFPVEHDGQFQGQAVGSAEPVVEVPGRLHPGYGFLRSYLAVKLALPMLLALTM